MIPMKIMFGRFLNTDEQMYASGKIEYTGRKMCEKNF